jgi:hypothetical protein
MPLLAAAAAPADHLHRLLHLLLQLLLLPRWQWVQPRLHPADALQGSPAGAACNAETKAWMSASKEGLCLW